MSKICFVAGLGNPGSAYQDTRHNIGFAFIDALASTLAIDNKAKSKYNSVFFADKFAGEPFYLQKPQTYMNRSGAAILPAMGFFKLKPENVLVVHDDLDLAFGKVRFKQGGGHGGHNGLKSIDAAIGKNYHRLRIGVGRPPHKDYDVAAYVLEKFSQEELQRMEEICSFFVTRLEHLLSDERRSVLFSDFAQFSAK